MSFPAGYASRPASWDDLDAVVELIKDCDLADVGFADPVRDAVEHDWRVSSFDVERDAVILVAADDRVTAYAAISGVDPSRQLDVWIRVHPAHRGRGLGAELVEWSERRARELAGPGAACRLLNGVPSVDALARRLLMDRGYVFVRTFWHMTRELGSVEPAPHPPDGIVVRTMGGEGDARAVHGVFEEVFAGHWGSEPRTFERWWEEAASLDPGLVLLAESDGRVIGAVTSGSIEDAGWVFDLGVLPGFRGRGIARALLLRSFSELAAHGRRAATLNVDSDNETGATRLYESVGMRVHRAWHVFEKPLASTQEPLR